MLESLRKSATGWVAKLFIGLLVISFAIWGIADIFRGYGTTSVAKVGETEIPSEVYRVTYNTELRNLGLRLRRPITAQEAVAAGLPNQILQRLINEATLNEEGRRLNLALSDEKLAAEVRSDPNLRGPDGAFSRLRLQELLFNTGISEDFYLAERRRLNIRRQISEAVAGGIQAPSAYLEALNQYFNEQRIIDYVVLDAASAGEIANPSDDALKKFFEERKSSFRAPEYRKLVIISADPKTLAKPDSVSEEDIKQAYDAAGTKYATPEKRFIRQIVFPNSNEAAAASEKLKTGATFDEIVLERGLAAADVDLGLLAKSEVIDPAIANAAFGLDKDAVSGVISGRFGEVIVQVSDIQAAASKPIAEVRDELAQQIAEKLAQSEVLELHDEIEDARAGGATLSEVAGRFKLAAKTIDAVDRTGKDKNGTTVELPSAAQLLRVAFDSDIGIENDPVHQANGFLWYDVLEVTPARDRTLEEARDKVIEAWRTAERDTVIGKRVTEILDRLKSGAELSQIATELGTEVKTSPELKRDTPAEGIDRAVVNAAFGGPDGYRTSVRLNDGSRVILRVKDVTPPVFFAEAEDVTQMRDQMTPGLFGSVLSQYVNQLQSELGVTINQATVARAIGLNEVQ